jgi:hypothetical protein
MHPIPSKCPVCGETLTVTRLHCPSCDTNIEGRFEFSRLERLSLEQRAFVEMFVRLDGKLNWAAQELKVSYPTVRSRLDDVIRAMGYEVQEAPPAEEKARAGEQRQAILDDLAAGKISTAEAIKQLQGL